MSEEMDRLRDYFANLDAFKQREAEWQAEQERLTEQNKALEAELDKTKRNRDAILAEKRIVEGKTGNFLKGTATELHISSADALDPQKYRAMKDLAARQGRTLRIVAEDRPVTQDRSPVKYVEDRDAGVLYANAAVRDRVGVARLQEIARERGLVTAKTFRRTDELPSHLHKRHAQIIADREPDSFVESDNG